MFNIKFYQQLIEKMIINISDIMLKFYIKQFFRYGNLL